MRAQPGQQPDDALQRLQPLLPQPGPQLRCRPHRPAAPRLPRRSPGPVACAVCHACGRAPAVPAAAG
eukprot:7732373-Alexandrium_andersonii.AAC.1